MNTTPMFSRLSDEWCTPDDFYGLLDNEFHFDFDAAASDENAKVGPHFSKEHDAITHPWTHPEVEASIYLNPPYSQVGPFLEKVLQEKDQLNGATVVTLLPARTDTQWWWNYVAKYAAEIRFLVGRLTFGLIVPEDVRDYIRTSGLSLSTLQELTGLPKTSVLAIQQGDEKLTTSAPFPSAVAVFRPGAQVRDVKWWNWKKDVR